MIIDKTELTLGQAVGELLRHYIDGTEYDILMRRRIIAAIPMEFRYADSITGKLSSMDIIQAAIDMKEERG